MYAPLDFRVGIVSEIGVIAVVPRHALGVNGNDDALVPEALGGLADDGRVLDAGGHDRDLVCAGHEDLSDVLDSAHAAADCEGNEDLLGGAAHDVEHDVAVAQGGGDIEEDQLIGALLVVFRGLLDGIAGVAEVEVLDALDDAAIGDVKAWDDSFGEHCLPLSLRKRLVAQAGRTRSEAFAMN